MQQTICGLIGLIFTAHSIAGADLRVAVTAPQADGSRKAIVSLYSPGEVISGIQFDITYDPAFVRILSVQPTDAIASQEKSLHQHEVNPGSLRVLMIGNNGFPMLNGAIVEVRFRASTEAVPRLVEIFATNPSGRAVTLRYREGDTEPNMGTSAQPKRKRR